MSRIIGLQIPKTEEVKQELTEEVAPALSEVPAETEEAAEAEEAAEEAEPKKSKGKK